MIKRFGDLADDLKTDLLPQADGDGIALDDKIELHRREPEPAGFVERSEGHLFADAFARRVRRDHVRGVCDVGTEGGLIRPEPKCANDAAIQQRYIIMLVRCKPVGHHVGLGRVGQEYISVAAGDCDNDGVPNAVEQAEGMNPLARDNDIFTIGRLFAMQQYRDFLGREGEPAGVQYWGTQVQSNAQTRAQVVTGFFNSSEFQGDVAPVVRLYLGTFLRIPDYAGVTYWVSQKKSGAQTLPQIARFFATSAEFVSRYGALSNSAFVTQLYQNILGRAPSASENAYWTGQLTSNAMTRGQVLLAFTDSAEHQAVSSNEIYVTMMYVGFLRRSPDAASFTTWLSFLDGGGSRDYMTQLFLDSAEYRGRFLP